MWQRANGILGGGGGPSPPTPLLSTAHHALLDADAHPIHHDDALGDSDPVHHDDLFRDAQAYTVLVVGCNPLLSPSLKPLEEDR
jgi:hypothetical protein